MSKHTPGPWRMGNHGSVVVDAAEATAVTNFYGGEIVCESIATMANAQLIAAAHELLEAIITANTALILSHSGRDVPLNVLSIIEENRALIAKAKGTA